jgi:hypothetical protein
MERCASCQAEVALLAAAADRLLDLVPERGAPDGFESRMAAAFRQSVPEQAARRHRGRAARCRLAGWWRRAGTAGAAAAAAGALGFGLYQIGAPPQEPAYGGAEVAALRTPAGAPAGEVAVTGAPQPLLVMVLNPGERLRALLACAIERSPFHARRLAGIDQGRFELADLAGLPVMSKEQMMAGFDELATDRRITRARGRSTPDGLRG